MFSFKDVQQGYFIEVKYSFDLFQCVSTGMIYIFRYTNNEQNNLAKQKNQLKWLSLANLQMRELHEPNPYTCKKMLNFWEKQTQGA